MSTDNKKIIKNNKITEKTSQETKIPPIYPGLASDLVIGLGISSAATECYFGGKMAFHVDLTGLSENNFRKTGNNQFIFKELDDLEKVILASKEIEKEGGSIIIGPIFSSQASEIRKNISKDIPIFSFTNDESIKSEGLWILGFSPQQQINAIFFDCILYFSMIFGNMEDLFCIPS